MPSACSLSLERTSLPQVKTSVTAPAGVALCHLAALRVLYIPWPVEIPELFPDIPVDILVRGILCIPGTQAVEEDEEAKSDEYSDVMQQRMGGSLSYRHEDGINFADILDDLMVGSCLQTPEDVDR